jgi:hypothetical protein
MRKAKPAPHSKQHPHLHRSAAANAHLGLNLAPRLIAAHALYFELMAKHGK